MYKMTLKKNGCIPLKNPLKNLTFTKSMQKSFKKTSPIIIKYMLKSVRIGKQETLCTNFEMGAHGISGMMDEGNSVNIGAVLEIKSDKRFQEIVPTIIYNV